MFTEEAIMKKGEERKEGEEEEEAVKRGGHVHKRSGNVEGMRERWKEETEKQEEEEAE